MNTRRLIHRNLSSSTAPACCVLIAVVAVGLPAGRTAGAKPPELKSLYPVAAGRGETVTIQAEGTFAEWPARVLVSGEVLTPAAVTIKPGEKKGELSVTVAGDAAPGVYLVRVADKGGISNARPLVVGTLPTVVEAEPNDSPDKPQPLSGSAVVSGKLQRSGDVDSFRLPLKQGQRLVASVEANRLLRSPMDAVLQVCTADGFVLDQNDDARGIDPLLVFTAPADGDYLVRIFAFPETANSSIAFAGGDDYAYRLTLTTGAFLDFTLPLAIAAEQPAELQPGGWNLPDGTSATLSVPAPPADAASIAVSSADSAGVLLLPVVKLPCLVATGGTLSEPQSIPCPSSISGRLAEDGQSHAFQLQAAKGQAVKLRVDAYELGYPLDPLVRVLDDSGKVLSEVDDVSGARDASLTFRPPADGNYRVVVRDLHQRGGQRFVYRLSVEFAEPQYQLSLASDAYTLEVGKALEIPVTVERVDGFDQPIEITAVDLPEGVTAETVVSEPKGDSAKAVKLKLQSDRAVEPVTFRVVGRAGEQDPVEARAGQGDWQQTPRIWLMVVESS